MHSNTSYPLHATQVNKINVQRVITIAQYPVYRSTVMPSHIIESLT